MNIKLKKQGFRKAGTLLFHCEGSQNVLVLE